MARRRGGKESTKREEARRKTYTKKEGHLTAASKPRERISANWSRDVREKEKHNEC